MRELRGSRGPHHYLARGQRDEGCRRECAGTRASACWVAGGRVAEEARRGRARLVLLAGAWVGRGACRAP